jgi:hypothetical protein
MIGSQERPVIARDIYRDFYQDLGPKTQERFFLLAKRLCVAFAGCALILSGLDLAGVHSISGATAMLQDAPARLASFGETVRGGISSVSLKTPSLESIRVAIPDRSIIRFSATKAPTVVDELASLREQDAVQMAMLTPQASMRDLSTVKAAPIEIAKPAEIVAPAEIAKAPESVKPQAVSLPAIPEIAARSQASVPPAEQIQSASLAMPESAPAEAALNPMSTTSLIPLSRVPLPRAAPPISPADRLGLKGTDYTKAERCLANAVYFEARSEAVRGQMAVAQVVLNRVFSPFYPNDVCSVVYQNAHRRLACQFTFACDGKSKAINERGAWARANRIARQTLDGQIYLPEVGKSTHYHASYVQPSWARTMHRLVKYGLHSFYRPYAWGNGEDQPIWGTASIAQEMRIKAASASVATTR